MGVIGRYDANLKSIPIILKGLLGVYGLLDEYDFKPYNHNDYSYTIDFYVLTVCLSLDNSA